MPAWLNCFLDWIDVIHPWRYAAFIFTIAVVVAWLVSLLPSSSVEYCCIEVWVRF